MLIVSPAGAWQFVFPQFIDYLRVFGKTGHLGERILRRSAPLNDTQRGQQGTPILFFSIEDNDAVFDLTVAISGACREKSFRDGVAAGLRIYRELFSR